MNSTAFLLSPLSRFLGATVVALLLGLNRAEAVTEGVKVTFTASAEGTPAVTFAWKKNGVVIPGATAATLVLPKVTVADAGTYRVIASNAAGSLESADEALAVEEVRAAAPVAVVAAPAVVPAPAETKAVVPVTAMPVVPAVNPVAAETKAVTPGVAALGNTATPASEKTVETDVTPVSVAGAVAPAASRFVNLSVRSRVGVEGDGLVVGFVLGGNATKPMLLRGVGPTLADFSVVGAMMDPSLALYSKGGLKGSNDNWTAVENPAEVRGMVERLGAFPLADTSADAAMVANLSSGAYTVELKNKSEESGVALLELYDAGGNSGANLVNLSVLARVEAGSEAPSLGFVVSGDAPKRVLIRAVGPTLAAFGVEGALADPKLEIFKDGALVGANDNWEGDAALSAAFASVGAFGLDDAASGDAALIVTLAPGAYTVLASDAGNATGTTLVEIYDLP